MQSIRTAIGLVNTVLIVIAGVALLALMAITVVDVFMGAAFTRLRGTQELVSLAGALVVACALGQTQERKDHVPVDIITRKYPAWLSRAVDVLKYTLKLAFALVVAWGMFQWALKLRARGELTENLKLPYWPVVMCVAGGFVVLGCTVVLDIVRTLVPEKPALAAVAPAGIGAAATAEESLDEEEVPLP